jgi:hypothetical protein
MFLRGWFRNHFGLQLALGPFGSFNCSRIAIRESGQLLEWFLALAHTKSRMRMRRAIPYVTRTRMTPV